MNTNPSRKTANEESSGSRITRVETTVQSVKDQVTSLETEFHNFTDRTDRQFGRIHEAMAMEFAKMRTDLDARRTPVAVWIAGFSLITFLFFSIGSAAYVPVWITTRNINDKAQSAIDWQHDYLLGRIPSSAEKDLAKVHQQFKELETQFKKSYSEHSIQFAENQRMFNITWQIAQGVHPIKYPENPYYFQQSTAPDGSDNIQ